MNKSKVKSQKSTGLTALTVIVAAHLNLLGMPEAVQAQPHGGLTSLNLHTARQEVTPLSVYPGRTAVIDFSSTNEVIFSIKLGDSSRTVYTTDVDLATGQAKTIYVESIQPLQFPGATTSGLPNLIVKTLQQSTGRQQLYLFNIHHRGNREKPGSNGVSLVSGGASRSSGLTWRVGNRVATLADIERGLAVALRQGWTAPSDPVVLQVREFLALAYNSGLTLEEAAAKSGVELAIISELAEIGLDYRLLEPPPPPSPTVPAVVRSN